jgi:trehalose-phosphatase
MMKKQRSSPVPFDFSKLKRLADRSHRVLMLDYDGTLAPFRAARMEAVPYPGVGTALAALCASGHTRVVIVSGRPVAEILKLLPDLRALEIWGGHGWEYRAADGTIKRWQPQTAISAQLDMAVSVIGDVVSAGDVERKQGSVAVHARRLSSGERAGLARAVEERWGPLCDQQALQLRAFDGGFELRDASRTKGTVVAAIRNSVGELSPDQRIMAYLGDDETDEDAFAALGPEDWSVLVRPEPRPTLAAHYLKPPDDLLRFIDTWNSLGA